MCRAIGYDRAMSFVLVAVLIAIVMFVGLRLIRHDARARPGAESHHPPES